MEYHFEDIKYSDYLGFKLFLHSVYHVESHWHNDFELLFVIKGSVKIQCNQSEITLGEGSLFLMNSNVVHSVESSDDNLLLAVQMPKEIFNVQKSNYSYIDFQFIKEDELETDAYLEVVDLLARLTLMYVNKDEKKEMLLKSKFYELVHILKQYMVDDSKLENSNQDAKEMLRIIEIINAANENFREDYSLSEYAEMFNLTPQYFSNYFKKYSKQSFMHYIANLRINMAKRLILTTDKNMTEIALECGFKTIKSFNTLFKQEVGLTPSQLRKGQDEIIEEKIASENNYLEIVEAESLKDLEKYMVKDEQGKKQEVGVVKRIEVDLNKKPKEVQHKWKNLITVGRASHLLNSEIQKMIGETQREIGFKYIRFHGIFDDDMLIFHINRNNEVELNFSEVEKLVDFCLSVGLKPFFEIGYMPALLHSKGRIIFLRHSYIANPKDMGMWTFLVEEFTKFLIKKYGKAEVRSWYFEFWNEPDVVNIFGFDNFEDYLILYKASYDAMKGVDEELRIGGPATLTTTMSKPLFETYVKFCKEERCLPDFITAHCYPLMNFFEKIDAMASILGFSENELSPQGMEISSDVDYLKKEIKKVEEMLGKYQLQNLELHMTEWNATPWHRDLCSDTTYKSAYIVKNILDNMDSVDSLAYWMLSDYSHEIFPAKELFHGGLGLFTHNGIKKPAYYAYQLLRKLGDEVVDKGEFHVVTKKENGYQVLLYNYCAYNLIYRQFDVSLINTHHRKEVFEGNEVHLHVSLKNIEEADYRVKTTKISTKSGSSFDEWLEIGAPKILQKEELGYLKSKAIPKFEIQDQTIKDIYEKGVSLEKNEVILIELVKY